MIGGNEKIRWLRRRVQIACIMPKKKKRRKYEGRAVIRIFENKEKDTKSPEERVFRRSDIANDIQRS